MSDVQSHHILPTAVYKMFKDRIDAWASSASETYNNNAGYNRILLPTGSGATVNPQVSDNPAHSGSHPGYNAAWINILNEINDQNVSNAQKHAQFKAAAAYFKSTLDLLGTESDAKSFLNNNDPNYVPGQDANGNTYNSLTDHMEGTHTLDAIKNSPIGQNALQGKDPGNGVFGAVDADHTNYSTGQEHRTATGYGGLDANGNPTYTNGDTYSGTDANGNPIDVRTGATVDPAKYGKTADQITIERAVSSATSDLRDLVERLSQDLPPQDVNDAFRDTVSDAIPDVEKLVQHIANLTARYAADGQPTIDVTETLDRLNAFKAALNDAVHVGTNAQNIVDFRAAVDTLRSAFTDLNAKFAAQIEKIPGMNGLSYLGAIGDLAYIGYALGESIDQYEAGDTAGAFETFANAVSTLAVANIVGFVGGLTALALGASAGVALAAMLVLGVVAEIAMDEFLEENPGWFGTLADLDFAIEIPVDPLIIDLDGDGLELISLDDSGAYFDLDGDGFAENTGWVAPDDGLLAIDSNGNGQIDDISELFGTENTTGYEELSELDSNDDGVIDANDAAFGDLLIWQDGNGDGESTPDELSTLSEAGITSIGIQPTEVDLTVEGNQVIETADVTFADGTTTQSWEVLFNMSQVQSEVNLPETFEFDEAVFTQPYLHGFGDVPDLWVSMTEDPSLLLQSEELISEARLGQFDAFTDGFDDFLNRWSGVEDMQWRQDVEGLETHFVFAADKIQDIYDLVNTLDTDTSGSGSSGGTVEGEPSYEGPRPSILAFIFETTTPSHTIPDEEREDYLAEIDGFSPVHSDDRPGFWNFAYTTAPRLSFAVGVGSSSNGIDFTIGEDLSGAPDPAPTMDVGSFVFLQKISGQDYRLADNFIAPENVVVATPSEAEIPALEDAYAEIKGYMAARYLVQSAQSILAEEGADADLGALEPFAHLTYNPFSDDIFGYTNEFVVGVVERFRDNGFGSDADALNLLSMFAGDIDELAALVAANYIDIDATVIEDIFGVQLNQGAPNSDDEITVEGGQIALGYSGDDVLTGGSGSSIFVGGAGDDVLSGGAGADVYVYRAGDGSDTIIDDSGIVQRTDELILTDYTVDDVQFLRPGGNDMQILLNDGATITISGQYYHYYDNRIEVISFADGNQLDLQEIRDKSVADQKSTGQVIGSSRVEHYFHTTGDGSYTIEDWAPYHVYAIDQLMFVDQLIGDVAFNRIDGDLRITLSNGEEVTVKDHFYGETHGMEQIIFADGLVYERQDILDKTTIDDQLLRDQVVADQKPSGTVSGTEKLENYYHTTGDGSYQISDYSNLSVDDRLVFTDQLETDVQFTKSGDDLVMSTSAGETLTISQHFRDNRRDMELIEFADGTVLDAQGIRDKSVADQKSTGSVTGSSGSESYFHASGDGSYDIQEFGGQDRFEFTDINADDVQFVHNDEGDLVMYTQLEVISIFDHFVASSESVETIAFADGTTFGLADILNKVDEDSSGTITGTNLDDILVGTTRDEQMSGGEGQDLFGITDGGGDDTITDFDTLEDRIEINGVLLDPNNLSGEVTISQFGADTQIGYAGGNTVTLTGVDLATWQDSLLAQAPGAVSGTNADDIINQASPPDLDGDAINGSGQVIYGLAGDDLIEAGAGADTVRAGAGDDRLMGMLGDDTLIGGTGADTFVFETGHGSDTIDDFEIGLDQIEIAGQVLDPISGLAEVIFSQQDEDLLVSYGTGDAIMLSGTSLAEWQNHSQQAATLDFNAPGNEVTSFESGQDYGQYNLSSDGTAITLENNAWKDVMMDVTINAGTILRFDFATTEEGEVHAIGFDNNNGMSADYMFQLDGTQSWGVQNFNNEYSGGGILQSYEIAIGQFYTGDFDRLVFSMDDDANGGGNSTFANIQIIQSAPPPTPPVEPVQIVIDEAQLVSFQGSQDQGTATVTNNGQAVELNNNAWKALMQDFVIEQDTVLRFEFSSDAEGEVHAIGFDNDNSMTADYMFQLSGSQDWGIQDFNDQYSTGSGLQSYEIPIGQFYAGSFDRLVFAMDDDANTGGDAFFANIELA